MFASIGTIVRHAKILTSRITGSLDVRLVLERKQGWAEPARVNPVRNSHQFLNYKEEVACSHHSFDFSKLLETIDFLDTKVWIISRIGRSAIPLNKYNENGV